MNKSNRYSLIRWILVLGIVLLVGAFAALCISADGRAQTRAMSYFNQTSQAASGQGPYSKDDGEDDQYANYYGSMGSTEDINQITVADDDGVIFSIDSETGKISPTSVDWDRVCKMSEKVSRSMKAVFRAMALQANHQCSKKD